jgi:hypothetical protein
MVWLCSGAVRLSSVSLVTAPETVEPSLSTPIALAFDAEQSPDGFGDASPGEGRTPPCTAAHWLEIRESVDRCTAVAASCLAADVLASSYI